MTPEQAEKIINEYGSVIAAMDESDRVQDVMKLPYSPGRIRYAIFMYTEALIEAELFDDEVKNNLETIYAMIDTRFVESPEEINEALRNYADNEDARDLLKAHGGLAVGLPSTSKMVEYHNYVAECYGNWGK